MAELDEDLCRTPTFSGTDCCQDRTDRQNFVALGWPFLPKDDLTHMPSLRSPSATPGNYLLSRLSDTDFERLLPHLQACPLNLSQVLHKARSVIDYVYFPLRGTASAVTIMENGAGIEVATVGNEGMVGVMAFFGAKISPNQVIVQLAGDALRMSAHALTEEAGRNRALHDLLIAYHTAFYTQVSQTVACNGLHQIEQRCCRWLLMTHDRVLSDDIPLTHEYLAIMLGVRRASVSEVLRYLQKRGVVENVRGVIRVKDRAGLEAVCCECYKVVKEEFQRLLSNPRSVADA